MERSQNWGMVRVKTAEYGEEVEGNFCDAKL